MERERRKQSRRRDTRWEDRGKGWWEVERWWLWSYNKKGGRGKGAHLEQRGGKEEIERDSREDGRHCWGI